MAGRGWGVRDEGWGGGGETSRDEAEGGRVFRRVWWTGQGHGVAMIVLTTVTQDAQLA